MGKTNQELFDELLAKKHNEVRAELTKPASLASVDFEVDMLVRVESPDGMPRCIELYADPVCPPGTIFGIDRASPQNRLKGATVESATKVLQELWPDFADDNMNMKERTMHKARENRSNRDEPKRRERVNRYDHDQGYDCHTYPLRRADGKAWGQISIANEVVHDLALRHDKREVILDAFDVMHRECEHVTNQALQAQEDELRRTLPKALKSFEPPKHALLIDALGFEKIVIGYYGHFCNTIMVTRPIESALDKFALPGPNTPMPRIERVEFQLTHEQERRVVDGVEQYVVVYREVSRPPPPMAREWTYTADRPTSDEGLTHSRLTDLVDENFGTRPTTTIDKLLDVLAEEIPKLRRELHDACEAAVEPNAELLRLRAVAEAARNYVDMHRLAISPEGTALCDAVNAWEESETADSSTPERERATDDAIEAARKEGYDEGFAAGQRDIIDGGGP